MCGYLCDRIVRVAPVFEFVCVCVCLMCVCDDDNDGQACEFVQARVVSVRILFGCVNFCSAKLRIAQYKCVSIIIDFKSNNGRQLFWASSMIKILLS